MKKVFIGVLASLVFSGISLAQNTKQDARQALKSATFSCVVYVPAWLEGDSSNDGWYLNLRHVLSLQTFESAPSKVVLNTERMRYVWDYKTKQAAQAATLKLLRKIDECN